MTINVRNPAFFPVVVGVALAGHCERPYPAGRPGKSAPPVGGVGFPARRIHLLGCAWLFPS